MKTLLILTKKQQAPLYSQTVDNIELIKTGICVQGFM